MRRRKKYGCRSLFPGIEIEWEWVWIGITVLVISFIMAVAMQVCFV